MVIALWIIVPIVTYFFMAGVLRSPYAKLQVSRCKSCENGLHTYKGEYGGVKTQSSIDWHASDDGILMSVFWPITLPWVLGSLITMGDRVNRKKLRAKARRAEELEQQQHQVELAKLRAKENEFLDRQLELEGRKQDR